MNKIRSLIYIIICIILLPFTVYAKECDLKDIMITSIDLEEKTDNVVEKESPKIDGENIILNLSMSEVGDKIKYKAVIHNASNEDLELDKNSFTINSNYIDYNISFEDNSNIVKSNLSKVVYLNIEYKKEIEIDKFSSGSYVENQIMVVNLVNKNDINELEKLTNPKTGFKKYFIFVLFLIFCELLYLIYKKRKNILLLFLIIGIISSIPFSIYALCKYNYKISVKVEITNNSFTGTIYRYNKILIKNGSNISKGYLIKNSPYNNELFNTLEECRLKANDNCEKINNSLLENEGFSLDSSSLNSKRYLRHDVENNIIKKTYVCFKDGDDEYCLEGGDNGISYSNNAQIIRDFNRRNSSCYLNNGNDYTNCSGSYGMEISADMNGNVSSYYVYGIGCKINSDGSSFC